jgi:hypothetical protein
MAASKKLSGPRTEAKMPLRMRPLRKVRTLNLSRAETGPESLEKKAERLEKALAKVKARMARRLK